jgi:transcriptional regulator of acetoin/glycerol metabolism
VLERAAVVAGGRILQPSDLGLVSPSPREPVPNGEPLSLDEIERRHIAEVMRHTGGNVSQAARLLGIDRVTLYHKMRKYQLRRDGEEDAADPR